MAACVLLPRATRLAGGKRLALSFTNKNNPNVQQPAQMNKDGPRFTAWAFPCSERRMNMAKKPTRQELEQEMEYEVEDSCDVPEDTVWVLDGHGNPVKLEVSDDV